MQEHSKKISHKWNRVQEKVKEHNSQLTGFQEPIAFPDLHPDQIQESISKRVASLQEMKQPNSMYFMKMESGVYNLMLKLGHDPVSKKVNPEHIKEYREHINRKNRDEEEIIKKAGMGDVAKESEPEEFLVHGDIELPVSTPQDEIFSKETIELVDDMLPNEAVEHEEIRNALLDYLSEWKKHFGIIGSVFPIDQ